MDIDNPRPSTPSESTIDEVQDQLRAALRLLPPGPAADAVKVPYLIASLAHIGRTQGLPYALPFQGRDGQPNVADDVWLFRNDEDGSIRALARKAIAQDDYRELLRHPKLRTRSKSIHVAVKSSPQTKADHAV
ncbi:hypothetical protein EIP91_009527 [Steccherinum ochraceum]|uniref:Uncharacterized protein n=1 Tax=Steccherinum ochraceum TaxID=92696 RepID=A0A4R0R1J5_9APHY|nr:hypothetical protein EIP91_009527 [Steccherinum ochraceum]